jgi:hypothetical protein
MQHKLPQHLAIENLILSHHSLIKISLTHSPTLFLSLSICPHNPRFPCSLSPHLCLSLPTDSLSLLVLPQSHLSQSLTRSTKKKPSLASLCSPSRKTTPSLLLSPSLTQSGLLLLPWLVFLSRDEKPDLYFSLFVGWSLSLVQEAPSSPSPLLIAKQR